ncbi:aspartyl protease family protein [Maribacter stanieri]|uniref:aspartyl protease family protein n=1 Tax=Maribacter stanieri TaxID=440514 RepID=UPI0024947CAF|nr:aspartyl protease family protein [Maribacter stanieri]|tara:strand:- start:18800 stop:20131 length:1332 start_codon:yes stop_codon:yes gene_type:complete
MLRKYAFLSFLLVCCFSFSGLAQTYKLPAGKKFHKVKFQLINNLIVIPIEVNGSELSFVLDSGVGTPILFNLADQDSIQLNNVTEITINGLGEGDPINALKSTGNFVQLGNAKNTSQNIYVVMDAGINFSPSLGIPVHGIIGYDLFRDFVVDINYINKTIKFYDPNLYKYRTSKNTRVVDMSIIRKKAYLDAFVMINKTDEIPVKMLLDTGSSDAVWLFEDERIQLPEKHYEDFLGQGLAGNIYGKRTKINHLKIADFILSDAKAAFPDMETFTTITDFGGRNGSLGGEVIKRFNIAFDYTNKKLILTKNSNFDKLFQYNISGIDLQHAGMRYVSERIADANGVVHKDAKSYGNVQIVLQGATRLSLVPEIIVSGIRQGSPAHSAGLREGDVILAVNGKRIHRYKLQEIMHMLNFKKDKKIKVLVERYDNDLLFSFVLKPLFD